MWAWICESTSTAKCLAQKQPGFCAFLTRSSVSASEVGRAGTGIFSVEDEDEVDKDEIAGGLAAFTGWEACVGLNTDCHLLLGGPCSFSHPFVPLVFAVSSSCCLSISDMSRLDCCFFRWIASSSDGSPPLPMDCLLFRSIASTGRIHRKSSSDRGGETWKLYIAFSASASKQPTLVYSSSPE